MNALRMMPRENRFPLMPDETLDRYGKDFARNNVVGGRKRSGAMDFEKYAAGRFLLHKQLVKIKLGFTSKF